MAKKKIAGGDACARVMCILGGVLCLITIIPAVPWRYAKINTNLGARFANDRSMSMFTITNQNRSPVPWLGMAKKMCDKMKMLQSNPMAAMAGMIMNAGASKLGGGKYTGGAMVGCEGWDACKNHVNARCQIYNVMAYGGLFLMVCQVAGSICCFCVPVYLTREQEVKKKKKKQQEAARWNTFLACSCGFGGCFVGTFGWIMMSHLQLKSLQSTAYYPWCGASGGIFMSSFGCFVMGIGWGISLYSYQYGGKKKKKDAEEEATEEHAHGHGHDEWAHGVHEQPPGVAH